MYSAEISRILRALFWFLIDRSGSMQDIIAALQKTKSQAVAEAVNKLLQNLVIKCSKGDSIRDYFDVGVTGYGGYGMSDKNVGPIFAGALAGRDFVAISDIAASPAKLEERTKKVSDGDGGLVDQKVMSPIWFEPSAEAGTPMVAAFQYLKAQIEAWVSANQNSFPPIIVHITDGESTDGDPTEAAKAVASLATFDGQVLLFNCHISTVGGQSVVFPNSSQGLDQYGQMLFGIS